MGKGIWNSDVERSDIFLTTKLPTSIKDYEGTKKAIGVSNFLQEDVANIVNNSSIKPVVNQIEVHIGNVPTDLMKYCKNLGIQIEAYSPLAHGRLLKDPRIRTYAEKYHVSPA